MITIALICLRVYATKMALCMINLIIINKLIIIVTTVVHIIALELRIVTITIVIIAATITTTIVMVDNICVLTLGGITTSLGSARWPQCVILKETHELRITS